MGGRHRGISRLRLLRNPGGGMPRVVRSVVARAGLCAMLLLAFQLGGLSCRAGAGAAGLDAVDDYINHHMQQYRIPGLALAVVEGGRVTHARGYGVADPSGRPVTPQTPFVIGSLTKMQTAMALLQLVEAGQVDLDAPVQRYLPWFALAGDASTITVRQVLNQTSGIPEIAGEVAWESEDQRPDALERQVRSLAGVKPLYPPGEGFQYANANYEIAGLIIQVVTGKPYENVVEERLFAPLDMRHSYTSKAQALSSPDGLAEGYRYWFGYPLAAPGMPYARGVVPAALLISTVADLTHVLIANLDGGLYHGTRILSPESVALLHHTGLGDYAMGWKADSGYLIHDGTIPSYGSRMMIDPVRNRGIVVLFNINNSKYNDQLYQVAPAVLGILDGKAPASNGLPVGYMTLLAIPAGVALAWAGVSVCALRQWRRHPRLRARAVVSFLWLFAPACLGLAAWGVIMSHFRNGLASFMLYVPDLGWEMVILLAGALVCEPVRIALSLRDSGRAPLV